MRRLYHSDLGIDNVFGSFTAWRYGQVRIMKRVISAWSFDSTTLIYFLNISVQPLSNAIVGQRSLKMGGD